MADNLVATSLKVYGMRDAAAAQLAYDTLRQIDGVAYVRFASVYREFKDLNEFREQLEQLLKSR